MKALAAIALLAAGCSSGFSVGITVDEQCPLTATKLQFVATALPGGDVARGEFDDLATFFAGAHRVVVLPPDGATSLMVTVSALDATGAQVGTGNLTVAIDGHQAIEATLVVSGERCSDGGMAADGPRCPTVACGGATPYCDTNSGRCVPCLTSDHCPLGALCENDTCLPGCSGTHGCGDAGGQCDVDAGSCHVCHGDQDCGGATPRCDLSDGRCVVCLPSPDNCPMGRICTLTNGQYQCALGCKSDDECKLSDGGMPTSSCCFGVCVDTSDDNAHCLTCSNACGGGKACCSSSCLDVTSNVADCGSCGHACALANAVATCVAASCAIGSCNAGFGDCNQSPSDGCETNVTSDPAHCGSCGTFCSQNHIAPHCTARMCDGVCAIGFGDCNNNKLSDGCETDIGGSVANCGSCGVLCSSNHITTPHCTGGTCDGACDNGFADCNNARVDGCEADLNNDPTHCGGCGKICSSANIAPHCTGGGCDGLCTQNFADCNGDKLSDGCEVSLNTDPTHCGGCNNNCPAANLTPHCTGGKCDGTCNAGFADCDNNKLSNGCETNITSDPSHCGSCSPCGAVANGAAGCSNGSCYAKFCVVPYADCNGIFADGCEANTSNDSNNCGQCGHSCGLNACVNGKCVIVVKHIFVSSQVYGANFGGLAGADNDCAILAFNAGLPGTWKAWMSDRGTSAASRMTQNNGPYQLLDGTTVVNSFAGFGFAILHAINLTEKMSPPVPLGTACGVKTAVWTDTDPNGVIAGVNDDCTKWSVASNNTASVWGDATRADVGWTDFCAGGDCSVTAAIYCVEQ